jgi:hypothetical protein
VKQKAAVFRPSLCALRVMSPPRLIRHNAVEQGTRSAALFGYGLDGVPSVQLNWRGFAPEIDAEGSIGE